MDNRIIDLGSVPETAPDPDQSLTTQLARIEGDLSHLATDGLRPAAFATAIVFILFAVYSAIEFPPDTRVATVIYDFLVIMAAFKVYAVCRRVTLSPTAVHVTAMLMSFAIHGNILMTAFMGVNPIFSYCIAVLLIAAAGSVLSMSWAIVIAIGQITGWAVTAYLLLPRKELPITGFLMASSLGVAFIVHASRQFAAARILELRDGDARRELALQVALAEADEARRGLDRKVEERTAALRNELEERTRLEGKLRQAQAQLLDASRLAGRSDVAIAMLHNVGNVLTSANVSTVLITDRVTKSKVKSLSRIAAMITEHRDDLGRFFHDDNRGKNLPSYFTQVAEVLEREQTATLAELQSLKRNIDHITVIISSQQSHVKPGAAVEAVGLHKLLDDALTVVAASYDLDAIEVVRQFDVLPEARLDRHKALLILTNLLANAHDAVMTKEVGARRISISARHGAHGRFEIAIEDNGCGIAPQDLDRIFALGFTTKVDGNGLGLHYSACAAEELHGDLTVSSAGVGHGSTFLLALPLNTATGPDAG